MNTFCWKHRSWSSPPPCTNLTPQSSGTLTSPDHTPSCLHTLPYALSHIQNTLLLCLLRPFHPFRSGGLSPCSIGLPSKASPLCPLQCFLLSQGPWEEAVLSILDELAEAQPAMASSERPYYWQAGSKLQTLGSVTHALQRHDPQVTSYSVCSGSRSGSKCL